MLYLGFDVNTGKEIVKEYYPSEKYQVDHGRNPQCKDNIQLTIRSCKDCRTIVFFAKDKEKCIKFKNNDQKTWQDTIIQISKDNPSKYGYNQHQTEFDKSRIQSVSLSK